MIYVCLLFNSVDIRDDQKTESKKALLIGMTHEIDHHKDNEFIEE